MNLIGTSKTSPAAPTGNVQKEHMETKNLVIRIHKDQACN